MPADPGSLSAIPANLQLLEQETGQVVPTYRPGTRVGWGLHLQALSPNPYRQEEDVKPALRCGAQYCKQQLSLSSTPAPHCHISPALLLLPICHPYPCFHVFKNLSHVAGVSCVHPLKWKPPRVYPLTGSCSHQPALILEHFPSTPKTTSCGQALGRPSLLPQP